jgi:hypothetical protein
MKEVSEMRGLPTAHDVPLLQVYPCPRSWTFVRGLGGWIAGIPAGEFANVQDRRDGAEVGEGMSHR